MRTEVFTVLKATVVATMCFSVCCAPNGASVIEKGREQIAEPAQRGSSLQEGQNASRGELPEYELAYVEACKEGGVIRFFVEEPEKITAILRWLQDVKKTFPPAPEELNHMPCAPDIKVSFFRHRDVANDKDYFRRNYTSIRDDFLLIFESHLVAGDRQIDQSHLDKLYRIIGLPEK